MRILLASRKSDLARLQTQSVAEALRRLDPKIEIEFLFSSSLGDQNQTDPLWQMPEKGVFTEDLTKKLLSKECDAVVHSWKDLPTEDRSSTQIVATLKRADKRDLILFRKKSLDHLMSLPPSAPKKIKVFSSSPRRILNVSEFLSWALPFAAQIEFATVRGNMATRVQKLLNEDADALVMAKAAFDRLQATTSAEFLESRKVFSTALQDCRWMLTPLSRNPCAPAQGALAIEILKERQDLVEIFKTINCEKTFADVTTERAILRQYGGGCHQKIGVAVETQSYGRVLYQRGESPRGERIDDFRLLESAPRVQVDAEKMFPLKMGDSRFYERVHDSFDHQLLKGKNLFVAREESLPKGYALDKNQLLWTSGVRTWRKLAERGYWVNGTQDALGEQDFFTDHQLNYLGAAPGSFIKLSHSEGALGPELELVPTYKLQDLAKSDMPDLKGKTHFFWASYSSFKRALAFYPEIRAARHACGPGNTYKLIIRALGNDSNVEIFVSYQEWLRAYLKAN